MNILEIVILVVLLLCIFSGYKNGFLKTVFSLVSWIVVLVICSVATPMVTDILIEKTEIETIIQSALDVKIQEIINGAMDEAGVLELPLNDMEFELPEELQAALPEEVRNMLFNEAPEQGEVLVDTAQLAHKAVSIISLLLVMVFSRMALVVVSVILGIASKLPLIGPLDKVLGLVCGAGKGVIWSWVVLTIVAVMALTGTNTEWAGYIADSQLLTWLQDNNMILNLLMN